MVNFIYPTHLRILASESERMKLLIEKDEELGEDGFVGEEKEEDSDSSLVESLNTISKGIKLGVIVDRMEHLQGLMDLLSCFIPFTSDSKLAVTGDTSIPVNVPYDPLLNLILNSSLTILMSHFHFSYPHCHFCHIFHGLRYIFHENYHDNMKPLQKFLRLNFERLFAYKRQTI